MTTAIKILVVDDEPLLQSLIEQNFEMQIMQNEMEFIFASNGLKALEELEKHKDIGVILTDINMPEMDGLTLLEKLTELERLYCVVVVSAYGDMKNIRTAMNRGARDFVTKPIDLQDLEITINNTITQFHEIEMAAASKKQVAAISKELEIARNIQSLFIPTDFEPIPGDNRVELYGQMIPAKEVGGDFFDFFKITDKELGCLIADVSGKGVPAALFMAMSITLIRAIAANEPSIVECLKRVNQLLCYKNDTCMFVTGFYSKVDIETGKFTFFNAGHPFPYIISKDGNMQKLSSSLGVPLGVFDEGEEENAAINENYKETTLDLKPGDTLVLFTDGVTEATNKKYELYGEERLEDYIKTVGGKPLKEIGDGLKQDVAKFVAGEEPSDDLTFLLVRYNGA